MNIFKTTLSNFAVAVLLLSCGNTSIKEHEQENKTDNSTDKWIIPLDELSDEDYKHNPDISIRHSKSHQIEYSDLNLQRNKDNTFTFTFVPNQSNDTIQLTSIELMEWIPTICNTVKDDNYLAEIAVVNQEWNRHQVKFTERKFTVSGANKNGIKRVDLARNCLNAYLWEVITYAEEDSILKPYYHGWFDFPKDLYAELFEERNNIPYDTYKEPLEEWEDPKNNEIKFDKLREVITEKEVEFQNLNYENYPLVGERKKKYINIVYPKNTTKMDDFLTDSTLFATFSPPGFYDPNDPRKTQLSLLKYPNKIIHRTLENDLFELEINYLNTDSTKTTKLFISGLNKNEIPTLSPKNVNDGWKNSMGFGNHTFYETYEHCLENGSVDSKYFALLTDEQNHWLDSHFVGIDGPLLHWDDKEEGVLHLWILAFERHAFVGHYKIKIGD